MARSAEEIIADLEKAGVPVEVVKKELSKRGVDLDQPPQQSMKDTVMDAIKNAAGGTTIGGMVKTAQTINSLPAPVQRAAIGGAATAVGDLAGPPGAAAAAAGAGAMMDMAENPQKTAEVLAPLARTALSPTPANVASVGQMATSNQQGIEDFAKRRAIEAATAGGASALTKGFVGLAGKPTGPISATFDNPSLASGGVRQQILTELGVSKDAAMAGDDLAEAARLRAMLGGGPAKNIKLAEEAIDAVKSGKDLTNTQLLAYEEALGKTQSRGGTFANVYKNARTAIREMLKEQAPTVAKYKTLARNVFLAQGEGEAPVTSLIDAIRNPATQAMKNPNIQRALGASTRVGLEAAPPLTASAVAALESLTSRRRR